MKDLLVNNDNGFQRLGDINIKTLNMFYAKKICSRESNYLSNKVLSKAVMKKYIFFNNKTDENRSLYGKQRIVLYS